MAYFLSRAPVAADRGGRRSLSPSASAVTIGTPDEFVLSAEREKWL
jgi:hypothetical protein